MKRLLFRFLLLVNISTILPLFLADLIHFINPQEWWFPQFLSYFYLYLLFFPLLFIIPWFFYDFRISLMNFLIVVLHSPIFFAYYQINLLNRKTHLKKDFRIVTYNANAFHYNPENIKRTIKKLKKVNPDILCFQEFLTIKMPYSNIAKTIQEELNLKYAYVDTLIKDNFAMGIFSRYPIKRYGRVTPKRLISSNGISYADIMLYGETLRVYNIHLHSYHFNKNSIQNSNLRQYWKILKTLVKTWRKQYVEYLHLKYHRTTAPRYTIIVGDLNNPPASFFYYAVKGSLLDAFREKGSGFSPTYFLLGKRLRIDFIFHTDNLIVDHYFTDNSFPSDHALVGVDFRFDFH